MEVGLFIKSQIFLTIAVRCPKKRGYSAKK